MNITGPPLPPIFNKGLDLGMRLVEEESVQL